MGVTKTDFMRGIQRPRIRWGIPLYSSAGR